jgi:hypothetical protein
MVGSWPTIGFARYPRTRTRATTPWSVGGGIFNPYVRGVGRPNWRRVTSRAASIRASTIASTIMQMQKKAPRDVFVVPVASLTGPR